MDKKIPDILPKQSYWMDQRLLTVRHNEFAWRATPPDTLEEWEEQRDFTRSQLALAAGLSPMPEMPELKADVWDNANYWGVVIRKVRIETMPGLVCTGNLFFPAKLKGKAPGILCPHGHWRQGRVNHEELGSIPLRCIMFARLGFVVFAYDMVGYCDNDQIIHRWPSDLQREAALYGVSPFGLQTWNSLRALDFLCDLPEVDSERIGCTGASGGASQTWTLAALDERIKVLAPVCMLSSHYQGGCMCEEGPLMRLNGVTSFDVLSACAPRPVFLPSVTRDWTVLNPTYEFEALKRVYQLFDAEDAIGGFHADTEHNYSQETREHVYPWFTHWLLNQSLRETIPEDKIQMPPLSMLLHSEEPFKATLETTKPALEKVKAHVCEDALPQLIDAGLYPEYQAERIPLLGEIVNNDLELADIAMRVTFPKWKINGGMAHGCLISRREEGDVIPAVWVKPDRPSPKGGICLLVSERGKADFFEGGDRHAVLQLLMDRGCECLAIDIMGSGETADLISKSPRDESDPLFFAFNPSLFSMRVQDILTCLALLKEQGKERITLVGIGEGARAAAIAAALAEPLKAVVLNLNGVEDTPEAWLQPLSFQPMIMKVGGMCGALSLIAPRRLVLHRPPKAMARYLWSLYELLKKPAALMVDTDNFLKDIEKNI